MGLFSASVSFRTASPDTVGQAYATAFPGEPACVSHSHGGWVTLVSESLDMFNPATLQQVASTITAACACPAVAFMVADSDSVDLWAYSAQGTSAAHFSAHVAEPGEPPEIRCPADGLAAIEALLGGDATADRIRSILSAPQVFADDWLYQLAELLGIVGVGVSYRIVDEECGPGSLDCLPGWEQFTRVGQ